MEVIVSRYVNSYEWISTESTPCMLFIKLKYLYKGYRVWAFPTLWMAKIWYRFTKKGIYRGVNVTFEKVIPDTDQITYHTPYHDMY